MQILCAMIAGLRKPSGALDIPGLYDSVARPSATQCARIRELPVSEAKFKKDAGRRRCARPSISTTASRAGRAVMAEPGGTRSSGMYVPPIDPGRIPPPGREIHGLMGEAAIVRMIEDFYRELERSSLRPLFPADMMAAAQKSAAFFVGLLGGPPLYHQRHGPPMMRARHLAFRITPQAREEWLACFERVLADAPARYGFPAQHLPGFRAFLRDFSMWMVNTQDE